MAKKNIKVEETTIDVEKLEREIKKEVKDSLLDELDNKIDGLVQVKIERYEKKLNKQKQRALLKKNIIIIILLGIVLYEGKILYDNGLLNNSSYKSDDVNNTVVNKDDSSNKEEVIEDKKDLEWYIKEYGYLLDNVKTNLVGEDFSYLYQDSYDVKDIDNKVRLNMAYQLLEKEDISDKDGFLTIDSSVLEEKYKTIFGETLEFKNEDFTNDCINFIYNESMDKYLAIAIESTSKENEIKQEIISVEEKEEKLIITTILGVYDNKEKTISNLDNTFNKKYKDNILEHKDQLNKFEYEFIRESDAYYFKLITKK